MFTEAFNYKIWADRRTLQAIEKINRNRFPDSYLFARQQINHMVIVEELFKSRLTNSPAPHPVDGYAIYVHESEPMLPVLDT